MRYVYNAVYTQIMNEKYLIVILQNICLWTFFLTGYPQEEASRVALGTVREWLEENPEEVRTKAKVPG